MGDHMSNLIYYTGISTKLPQTPTTFAQFTQTEQLCLQPENLDIQQVTRVDTQIQILNHTIIKTPVATSLEGQILTGYKAIVIGCLKHTIVYTACTPEHSVHSAFFSNLFCRHIVLPSNFMPNTPIKIFPYVESVFVDQVCQRSIAICTGIFINIKTCPATCCYHSPIQMTAPLVIGLAQTFPKTLSYFKELTFDQPFTLPSPNPDIERITSITISAHILSSRLISTPTNLSLEGQSLSGCKLLLELEVHQMITYVSCNCSQGVHSAYLPPFLTSTFVVVPCTIGGQDTSDLLDFGQLRMTPYIEGAYATCVDARHTFNCATILINISTC